MKIGVTIGDPAGIGPEIACKMMTDKHFTDFHEVVLIGYKFIIEKVYRDILKMPAPHGLEIIEPEEKMDFDWEYGKHSADCGKASMLFVKKGVDMCLNGELKGIVTCPINKKSIQMGGFDYPGHTEYLAERCGVPDVSMLLAGNKVRTVLATTHMPLAKVAERLTSEDVYTAIKNANYAGKFFVKNSRPSVAVCGLNPHAGDNGALGDEEATIIMPAIERARKEGMNASDPLAADSLFPMVLKGEYDFVVTMYHDQGLIPVKMDSFGSAVNISLNLSFIRTSVDHGTAFNIAGKNIAQHTSLVHAVKLASDMCSDR